MTVALGVQTYQETSAKDASNAESGDVKNCASVRAMATPCLNVAQLICCICLNFFVMALSGVNFFVMALSGVHINFGLLMIASRACTSAAAVHSQEIRQQVFKASCIHPKAERPQEALESC